MSSLKMVDGEAPARRYWRSLDELADTPAFRKLVEDEFPAMADEMLEPTSRRSFLKFMGASVALAGMTACRWPKEEILPFVHRPEGYVPGQAVSYATSLELDGAANALLVTSYDGRPIKIEGNPQHPASLGGTSAFAQASLLELYDPDRSREVLELDGDRERVQSWEAFTAFAREHFAAFAVTGGTGLRVLAEPSSSPTLAAAKQRFLAAFPAARWFEFEPLSRDAEREGTRLVLGTPHRVHPDYAQARVIVSFDEDFLLHHPAAVRHAREFAHGRDPERGAVSRLWVVEPSYSVTGSMADHRLALPSREVPAFAAALAARLLAAGGLQLPAELADVVTAVQPFSAHPQADRVTERLERLVQDLLTHRGAGVLVAGPRQPPALHALVHALNLGLGNVGRTVQYTPAPDPDRPSHLDGIRQLADELQAGRVETLVILGGNPAFDAPADLEFGGRLARAKTVLRLGGYVDETSRRSTWHLPRAHYLESWSDARDWQGTVSIVQPLIEPLFGGRTAHELLALLIDEPQQRGYDLVRQTFEQGGVGHDERAWRQALHDGWIADSAWEPTTASGAARGGWGAEVAGWLRKPEVGEGQAELVFLPSANVHDGRFANNGWLQELPEPLTKLTWDNAALVAPSTAARWGVRQGDLVRLGHAGRALELPVYVMPGQAAGSVGVALGYGRRHVGKVGIGVGFDAYALRTQAAPHAVTVSVEPTGGRYRLATTQEHYAIDTLGAATTGARATELAREVEYAEFVSRPEVDPHHAEHGPSHPGPDDGPLWKAWEYNGYKWAMAIDLNACTGCNACVMACQAENNIPVVGKDEVLRGREMQWIRIDRYFSGEPEEASVSHQPMACQHCENAPCESVCPVAATVHDQDGLNVMVYNRCVGTRYCSNNCPYKVRRFNWFNNHKHESALEAMVYNPEVSLRSRGVMEKCTFCVQRINKAKIHAKNERRDLADGEITPACAQACPTQAITFGDLNLKDSRVSRLHEHRRAYGLLEWLAVKPRTRYLERLRNRGASDRA